MKDYQRFITFIVSVTAAFHWVNSLNFCSVYLIHLGVNCPIFSGGVIITSITLLFYLWNEYLWKIKKFPLTLVSNVLGLYDYPDLSGEWEIEYSSSYKQKNNQYQTHGIGSANVVQKYDLLSIEGIFGTSSHFESFFSQLKKKESGKWYLIYGYSNSPDDTQLQSSENGGGHKGFAYLEISSNCRTMEGFYSNDEVRKTRGKLTFRKK